MIPVGTGLHLALWVPHWEVQPYPPMVQASGSVFDESQNHPGVVFQGYRCLGLTQTT